MASESSGELVVPGELQEGLAVPASWQERTVATGFRTSLDRAKPSDREKIAEMMVSKGDDVQSWLNVPFVLTGYLLSPASFADKESGEQVTTIVTRLIREDGSWCETHSAGVFKSLDLLVSLMGQLPWKPAKQVVLVREKLSSSDRSWITLRFAKAGKTDKSK